MLVLKICHHLETVEAQEEVESGHCPSWSYPGSNLESPAAANHLLSCSSSMFCKKAM